MALNNGPYYTTTSHSLDGVDRQDLHHDASIYPDLAQSMASTAQTYSLADGALQAHQRNVDSNLAGLIRAATVAAGQVTEIAQSKSKAGNHSQPITRRSQGKAKNENLEDGSFSADGDLGLDRSRGETPEPQSFGSHSLAKTRTSRKRKRFELGLVSDRGQDSDGHISHDSEHQVSRGDGHTDVQSSVSSARDPVTHSAAALFRRPSATSKKYTRPPMSKLFASLELSPESFLHLQAAAKTYMLDGSCPERRDCVGQRGKGDSELVKLRLWNCVKAFLEDEGNGEKFFASHISGDEGVRRTMTWPTDKNRIIGAVTPLLRRMVTNERQRQYAVETRKPGVWNSGASGKKRKLDDIGVSSYHDGHRRSRSETRRRNMQMGLHELCLRINGGGTDQHDFRDRYDVCNLASRLDNLSILAGLPEADYRGLVATIDYHLMKTHSATLGMCDEFCEEEIISKILATGLLDHGQWRSDLTCDIKDKHDVARSILREVFRTVKQAADLHVSSDPSSEPTTVHNQQRLIAPSVANQVTLGAVGGFHRKVSTDPSHFDSPLVLHCSVLEAGRRVAPRYDTSSLDCPDIETLMDQVRQGQAFSSFKPARLSVLLPDGLCLIGSDEEWNRALTAARSVDWMDGDLKVIIEM